VDRFFYNIDVVGMGQCNLRCPSCPVGNMRVVANPMGLMDPEILRAVMVKATSEAIVTGVGLYNFGEPLLHPQLPELVRIVRSFGVACNLSSNLNFVRDLDELMLAGPSELRVSLSGFTQEVYGRTHVGGDIDVVKANMKAVAEAKERTGASTVLEVVYHRYRGNLDEEIAMRTYALSLGYRFTPVWALLVALEKVLAYDQHDPSLAVLTEDDHALLERLVVPLPEALEIAKRHRSDPCTLLEDQVTLDFRGDVMLCCAVYDANKYKIASYLQTPIDVIQGRKKAHAMCGTCTKSGGHVYVTFGAPEFNDVSVQKLFTYYAAHLQQSPAYTTAPADP
jgi:hypothetical protein